MGDSGNHASGLTDSTESSPSPESGLYFFPEEDVSEERVRRILEGDDQDEKAWVVSHLLRFAQWDDIWRYVDRDQVREIFPRLDLPETLRSAWARILKIEVEVG